VKGARRAAPTRRSLGWRSPGSIGQNDALPRLTGLASLEWVQFSLQLIENPNLVDLQGLEALTHVGWLVLQDNPLLRSVDGLDSLSTVDQQIEINGNGALANLRALGNVTEASDLRVWNSPSLPTCEAEWLAEQIGLDNVAFSGTDDTGVCP